MTNTTTIPQNIYSYDSGNKPFKHDAYRGKWKSIHHFYLSCLVHSFGGRYFSLLPLSIIKHGGIYLLIPCLLNLFVFTVPVFFVQSFLGQFSSSGFISAFRIAPLFKGLGYTILVLNIATACYFSILASFPLVFFFASFSPQLPWMTCENSWNTENCTEVNFFQNYTYLYEISWSSEEFLLNGIIRKNVGLSISWPIILCTLLIWILVAIIVIQGIEMIGKILEYFSYIVFVILVIIFIRVLCVPGCFQYLINFFDSPDNLLYIEPWAISPLTALLTFGSGWGTILTMASYNNFNTNIGKYSSIIGFSNLGILIICGLISFIIDEYLLEWHNFRIFYFREDYLGFTYAVIPFFFGHLYGSNLWSIIFYFALFLGELSGFVIQMHSILTAIFDEYDRFRSFKQGITVVLLTILMILSLGFTINKGVYFFVHFFLISGGISLLICFIELMIIVWIYGRLRFQRDVEFMVKRTFSTWKFYMMRFVTPLPLLFAMLFNFIIAFIGYHYPIPVIYSIAILLIKLTPILIFPIFVIYKFNSTVGTFCERFRKLCRPTDWYPADPIERRNYEVFVSGTSDILIDDDIEFDGENNNNEG